MAATSQEKLIQYCQAIESGGHDYELFAEKISRPRKSVYDIVKVLVGKNLVTRKLYMGKIRYTELFLTDLGKDMAAKELLKPKEHVISILDYCNPLQYRQWARSLVSKSSQ